MGVGVGVGVAVGLGSIVESKSSSSSKDVDLVGAEEVDDSNEVAPDNVIVAGEVEALPVNVVELDTVAVAVG